VAGQVGRGGNCPPEIFGCRKIVGKPLSSILSENFSPEMQKLGLKSLLFEEILGENENFEQ